MTSRGGLSVTYRRAERLDVGALVEFRIDLARLVKDCGIEDEAGLRSELVARFARDLASGELAAWVCLDAGRIVATSALARPEGERRRAEFGLGPGEGLVLNVYTRPAYRRRGIATELLSLAVAEARATGLSRLRLQPTGDSRRVYERAGFRGNDEEMTLDL